MQQPRITLISQSNYGREMLYPACEHGRILCQMLGTKTMPDHQIVNIRKLGYEVRIQGKQEINLPPLFEE